ncbi:MAG TPA: polysaccharide pyruvyl transferase CsaB [Bacillota bacterium]|jgi:polysaccharide pyruvyl transferase CsaB|nr:polysaccharide pyruvyl transferase CsaB [Bacillota bacterium]
MTKILISGYYGFNNIGDESILQAVVHSLREQLSDIEITVLSQSPASTREKYGVASVDRKSLWQVLKAVKTHDLLISGGGSLLQDVTSKRSILYYLAIMWMAKIFRKDFFIYSQGIGPIHSKWNRLLTKNTLAKASGIVVRDQASKELLTEIGIEEEQIFITADPVLRIDPVPLELGKEILESEGFQRKEECKVVGFAIKEKQLNSPFVKELEDSIRALVDEKKCQVVLIPFHYQEDLKVIEELERRLSNKVFVVKHKYLTNEMLSLIGNMDVLVGVRLHSLIHGAIMGVKLIGISYDPKINAFMGSIGLKALSTTLDFQARFFLEEYDRLWEPGYGETDRIVKNRVKELVDRLVTNEAMIQDIINQRRA